VTMETDWFTLRDARLQLAHYTQPHLPVAVAHSFSPAGPKAAGRYGLGMLSIAASQPRAIDLLRESWEWAEEEARASGATLSRDGWRVVIPFHLAESREQAFAEARDGALAFNVEYFIETLGRPSAPDESLEATVERGGAIVGTPDDAIAAIEHLQELSGGFGGLLGLAHEWAPLQERTWRSYELWARYVAPHFQGQLELPRASQEFVAGHGRDIFGPPGEAVKKAFDDAGIEVPEGMEGRYHRGGT
jgi:limonene 1,2-monooxygenase